VDLRDSLPEPASLTGGDGLLSLALSQRLDARAAEFRARAADQEVRQQWLKMFPSLTVGIDGEELERRALPNRKILADTARESIASGGLTAPGIESRAQRDLERRQEIDFLLGPSFAATLPIFDQNQAQIAKAKFQAIQRRKDYEGLLNQIASQVEQAVVTLQNTREIVEFYRKDALPQSDLNLEGARRLYQAGEQGIVVVIEAQESLITRRRAYVRAMGEYAAALAELERAVGGRLPAGALTAAASQPAGGPAR
jgi:outer membrane protein TolC